MEPCGGAAVLHSHLHAAGLVPNQLVTSLHSKVAAVRPGM